MNTFRPHNFALASGNINAAPVNHPALVKTSDQPSLSSSNFSPLTSAEALRSSDMCQASPKSKSSWWNSKENNELTLQKYFQAIRTEKIKQVTKSKTWQLASNALLGPSKRRKRRVCRDPTPSDTPSDSETELAVPLANDSTEENEEQDAECVFCTGRFSEHHHREEWIWCAKYFRWAHTLYAGMEEDFVCEPCQGWTLFCS
jgi:hypothetical protein